MFSATVIALRSKSDGFYNSWTRKIKLFSISSICDINNKGRKISGVAWTLLDAQKHRMIMATRHKFSGLSRRLTAKDSFCINTYSVPWRASFITSSYVKLNVQFLYSLVRFRPIHSLFICSICLFIYIIIISL